MVLFYLDSSAIVKRYRRETGTDLVDALFEHRTSHDQFVSSFLSVLEVTSAVYRLQSAGELRESTASGMLSQFRRDLVEQVRLWTLDEDIAESAIHVVESYRPRAADAIHLATALAASAAADLPIVFVSADRDLIRAASEAGLQHIDPAEAIAVERLRQLRMS